jgi:glycerol uptake facilitator protein
MQKTSDVLFWNHFTGEMIGTFVLILFGCGVVANVVLNKTKGQNSGWIVITIGWAMAVFLGVSASLTLGGSGHINPAVTIAMTAFNDFPTDKVLPYIIGQFTGAIIGAITVWIAYKQHFDETADADLKLAVFCTAPAIRNPFWNLATEVIGTFILIFGALFISQPKYVDVGSFAAFPVALLVLGIGLSLGGPTGYAINPARDLGPRIAHAILPIPGKRNGDWKYSWIPVLGPIVGALLAAFLFKQI